MDVLVAPDLFTAEVWMKTGLVTYDARFFIHPASRKENMAGITVPAGERWVVQTICPVIMTDWG